MGDVTADLLTEAFTDPTGVIAEVGERLNTASPSERCQLLRALGNACRELRRTSEATMHHEAALDLAEKLGDGRLVGLAAMSLSSTLTYDGAFDRALLLIDRSVELLDGDDHLVALTQRAAILQRAGRHHDALDAFDDAIAAVDGASDRSLEWDLWTNRGVLYGWLGQIGAGEADTQRALDMFQSRGWNKRAADAQHNLAWLAGRRGDIVEALRYFDLAQSTYEQAGVPSFAIFPDRCETLLAAGLAREALATAERSATRLGATGDHADRAEALLLVARSAIFAGRPDRASAAAHEASALFSLQHRAGWSSAADALAIECRLLSGRIVEADLDEARAISDQAAATGLREVSVDARLLAADIAAVLHDWDACEAAIALFDEVPLGVVARFRLEHLRAQAFAARGKREAAVQTCIVALDTFADLAAALGGTEMRASVAIHANHLAGLGLRLALDEGDPATVLEWAERHRASALAAPPVQPPEDIELEHQLNELRAALLAVDETARAGQTDREAQSRVAVAQERVRRRVQRTPGRLARNAASVGRELAVSDPDTAWAVFLQSERRQYAVYARGTEIELVELGSLDEMERAAAN
ncbi:MAG TPA: hypothetical protein VE487_19475, partial [Ilumatobacter sp.]|nr:hypothetical protein [Ilumatobacter sp.]